VNKLILIGNVGRDPEMRITPSGQSVTSFSVASNRRYKTASGEQREETEWFNCQAWGKLAEVCNAYLTKGQQVYIEGRLKSRTYQTQNGETRFSNDVTVNEFQFLGKRTDQASPDDASAMDDDSATDDSQGIAEDRTDDLPWESASSPRW
jgi:single-strand DNA-binding protein